MEKNYDEAGILQLLAQGDEPTFAAVYDRYKDKVYRSALSFLKEPELAEEVVQEVFMKAWRLRHNFAHVENLNAYIFTMAKSVTYNLLAKIASKRVAESEYVALANRVENTTERVMLEKQYKELLQQAIALLTPQQKLVFHLCKEEGMSQQAVAQQLDISPFTVNKHVTDALRFLRKCIKPYLGA